MVVKDLNVEISRIRNEWIRRKRSSRDSNQERLLTKGAVLLMTSCNMALRVFHMNHFPAWIFN